MRPLSRFSRPYSYIRPGVGSLSNGRWVQAEEQNAVTFQAVIQPATGPNLLLLPEGQRTKDSITIYTQEPLQLADEATKQKGDRVSYQGRAFEVQKMEVWTETGLPHYQFLAQLVEADTQ